MLGANAACCGDSVGLEFDGGLQIGDSVADVKIVRRPNGNGGGKPALGGSFLEQLEQVIQEAVHPDSAIVSSGASRAGTSSFPSSGSNVIPFPVVSPYRPITQTRSPVAGLNAFPKSGYYFNGEPVNEFNVQGDEDSEVPGYESLSGLGSFGMKWEGVIGQITQTVPGVISAFKGNQYYDPSQNMNPQLQQTLQQYSHAPAPEGYYYDQSGALQRLGASVGAGAGNIAQGLSDFVTENPLIVLAGGAALFLLFMKPPSRR